MTDKPNPYDIEALESAVNDSATRVSAIWITFLVFSLYLLIAATTVTQRQLFLAGPVKLPVLNVDLPLWGFFFLAPILFVILHGYVLLQVLLLGRTAAAYNAAVERMDLPPEANNSLRQRLANTLFAQIFAGSPREREGFIGRLLKGMAWITLAIAPIFVLLAFQFSFLAYHSHIATWTHRLLIVIELAAIFLIWPLALNAQRDFQRPQVGTDFKRLIALPVRLITHADNWHDQRTWLRQNAAPLLACMLFVIVSLSIATFPGEPHLNLFTAQALKSVQCKRWLNRQFDIASMQLDLRFDRIVLPLLHVIDDEERFTKIADATAKRNLADYEGERTIVLRNRDLNCIDLSSADLRRADLTGARLTGATLESAVLEGASLEAAQLQGANLSSAKLQDAKLDDAQLQEAHLENAELQGAQLFGAQLQGANLSGAKLEAADLFDAALQGVNLSNASLEGAFLILTRLQGANLDSALLQGAYLRVSRLEGASLHNASLQGATFTDVAMDSTVLDGVWVWRAQIMNSAGPVAASSLRAKTKICGNFRSKDSKLDQIIKIKRELGDDDMPISATAANIKDFIDRAVAGIPNTGKREKAAAVLHARLDVTPANDDTAALSKVWIDCEAKAGTVSDETFDKNRAVVLRNLVCEASKDQEAIAAGIIREWIISDPDYDPTVLSIALARGLLGQDGRSCAAAKDFDRATMTKLHAAAAMPVPPPAPSK